MRHGGRRRPDDRGDPVPPRWTRSELRPSRSWTRLPARWRCWGSTGSRRGRPRWRPAEPAQPPTPAPKPPVVPEQVGPEPVGPRRETARARTLAYRWHVGFTDVGGGQGMLGQVEGRTADDVVLHLVRRRRRPRTRTPRPHHPDVMAGGRGLPPHQDHECGQRGLQPRRQTRRPQRLRLPQPGEPTATNTLRNHPPSPRTPQPRSTSMTPYEIGSRLRAEVGSITQVRGLSRWDDGDLCGDRVRDEALVVGQVVHLVQRRGVGLGAREGDPRR